MSDTTAREGVVPEEAAEPVETEEVTEEVTDKGLAYTDPDAPKEAEGEGSDEESDEEEQEPEVDIFDFGGNKMELPKGSVPEELRAKIEEFSKGTWSDYTRKSQAIAEQAKALEARESAVEKIVSLNGDALQTYSQGLQIKAELEQLSRIDMNAMWQSDPDQARRVSDRLAQKQAEFQSVVSKVSNYEQQLSQAQQAELARRKDEGKAVIERTVKGFVADHLPAVLDYAAESLGISREEAERDWALSPKVTLWAHKAMLYDRMQAKTKAPAPKQQTAAPVTPIKGKGGKAAKDPDKMTPDEWLKWRNAQIARG